MYSRILRIDNYEYILNKLLLFDQEGSIKDVYIDNKTKEIKLYDTNNHCVALLKTTNTCGKSFWSDKVVFEIQDICNYLQINKCIYKFTVHLENFITKEEEDRFEELMEMKKNEC